MADRDPDAYAERNWPWLLIIFCAGVLLYKFNGNTFAGVGGFAGLGWLAWIRLIKPRL